MIYNGQTLTEQIIKSGDICNRCIIIDCIIEEGAIVQRSKVISDNELEVPDCDCGVCGECNNAD